MLWEVQTRNISGESILMMLLKCQTDHAATIYAADHMRKNGPVNTGDQGVFLKLCGRPTCKVTLSSDVSSHLTPV